MIRSLGAAVAAAAVLAACGGGGPIEENVVRPGITAMEQASALACSTDAEVLRKSGLRLCGAGVPPCTGGRP